jgi:hypothetical protein
MQLHTVADMVSRAFHTVTPHTANSLRSHRASSALAFFRRACIAATAGGLVPRPRDVDLTDAEAQPLQNPTRYSSLDKVAPRLLVGCGVRAVRCSAAHMYAQPGEIVAMVLVA